MAALIPTRGIVAAEARRLGVDLTTVTGTGTGGRISLADVRAVAAARTGTPPAGPRLAPVTAPPVLRSLTTGGRFAVDPGLSAENAGTDAERDVRIAADEAGVALRHVRGTGAGGRITLGDVLAASVAQDAQRHREYAAAQPAPAVAQLPAFTASGIPVSALQQVPASVRSALAAAPTTADAFALVQRYRDLDDEDAAARLRSDPSVSVDDGGAGPSTRYSWPT